MERFQHILEYRRMKGIQFQHNSSIQNIGVQERSTVAKVNLHSQVEVKEMKEVNEAFLSKYFEVQLLNMN
jgi:hypothetical protein